MVILLVGSVLVACLQQRGVLTQHAGAIETEAGAVLFLGHSGAGKSTLHRPLDHERRKTRPRQPLRRRSPSTVSRSARTMPDTSSAKVHFGSQPRTSRAFVASPTSRSTSAGRK